MGKPNNPIYFKVQCKNAVEVNCMNVSEEEFNLTEILM